MQDTTVAIVARNAAATIGRAVGSALAAGAARVLLVDDASSDETVSHAKAAGGESLTVIENRRPLSVGYVRGLALEHIQTPYGIWLDADDAFGAGHLEAMLAPLTSGDADLVLGAATLYDGATGQALKPLHIPDFMQAPEAEWRSFERNWYPSLHAAFRTEFARGVGYDPAFKCAEDYDFLLRAIAAGARVATAPGADYHYYHYDGTISRNRERTRSFTARSLAKHDLQDIGRGLTAHGFLPGDRAAILASAALFAGEPMAALAQASEAAADTPVASYGEPARRLAAFYRGVAFLMLERWGAAAGCFELLEDTSLAAEAGNNHAVTLAALFHSGEAIKVLERVLALKPDYLDARANLAALKEGGLPAHITTHPFRREASRDQYAA